ncbi:MAG: response regulator [Methylophaga sp.]|nr:response regulator [Methylophaga sp.]
MAAEITVLLVDDHIAVREGYRLLLAQFDITVIAEADSGEKAFNEYQRHKPNIVLMDLSINGMNGLDSIARIILHYPDARIIALSMHDNTNFVSRSIENGAMGYVLKSNPSTVLLKAIHQVHYHAKKFLCPEVSTLIAMQHVRPSDDKIASLTTREYAVFLLLTEGKTRNEIASSLSLSTGTVSNNKVRIMQKLAVNNMVDLLKIALEHKTLKHNQIIQ